ncbi:hypothetical protein LTR97_012695 [Elasticomyces elasticus]|uniref:Uncharacterized protein n=1 Tax=Elasticomyces elasticus TaxID=574655 RepID=A0AAN7VZB9_9PEZI|nr:hypothetical protein LTR97_012695 [Elasticomyces elasticus]
MGAFPSRPSQASFTSSPISSATAKIHGLHLTVSRLGIYTAFSFAHGIAIARTKFRFVGEDEGATLHFGGPLYAALFGYKFAQQRLHHVGTFGLITCVGVYFAINDHTCFIAHINACTIRDDGHTRTIRNDAEGATVKLMTLVLLHQHARFNGWSPRNLRTHVRIRRSLLLMCPEPEFEDRPWPGARLREMKQTGFYVAEAIREFLNVPAQPLLDSGGFVVEHPGGVPVFVPEKGNGTIDLPVVLEQAGFEMSREADTEDWVINARFPGPAEMS